MFQKELSRVSNDFNNVWETCDTLKLQQNDV